MKNSKNDKGKKLFSLHLVLYEIVFDKIEFLSTKIVKAIGMGNKNFINKILIISII